MKQTNEKLKSRLFIRAKNFNTNIQTININSMTNSPSLAVPGPVEMELIVDTNDQSKKIRKKIEDWVFCFFNQKDLSIKNSNRYKQDLFFKVGKEIYLAYNCVPKEIEDNHIIKFYLDWYKLVYTRQQSKAIYGLIECPECKGTGVDKEEFLCLKCLGEGNLDWVENLTGGVRYE